MNQAATAAPRPEDAQALIEAYYAQGWTDGLPVVPPSAAAVEAMLAAAGLPGDAVLGHIHERNTTVTADKVAVNAVLAGCLPDYMPVVVAAVKGLCHPDYGYHGPATSTGGASTMLVVNGPLAAKLGINSGGNAFGPGPRANLTIGRALRLTMMNALNTRPGKLDRSTLGNPAKLAFCLAENEADSPWAPLHVERGFAPESSTATVFAAESIIQVYNQLSRKPEELLRPFADAMANLGSMGIVGHAQAGLVLAGEHCAVLRAAGWSKDQVRETVHALAKRTVADCKRAGRLPGALQPQDEQTWRQVLLRPEDLFIVAAGGEAGAFSAVVMGWGSAKHTRSLTTAIGLP